MMKLVHKISLYLLAILATTSCIMHNEMVDVTIGEEGVQFDSAMQPSCIVESHGASRAKESGISVRSLVDQITTKQLNSNFLRIDEDLNLSNDGLYSFTGNDASTPYATNWNKAQLLEATVISSPDNTAGIHYRSIYLSPEQSYKLNIVETSNGGVIESDTTHFYHTRLVGWYPMNCVLPRREGVPATAQFEYSEFDAVRLNETVEIEGKLRDVVAIQFTGLDGETDLMVSNMCEGQSWHKYNSASPHRSDKHPLDGSNIYREPFGHNFTSPAYSNYLTYRHYRSAIRLTGYAEQSEQNLIMWGKIDDIVIRNQPTSCKVWLPTHLGEFGEVYHWGNYQTLPIVCTPMFDNDSNHPEYSISANYPISMKGSSSEKDIYLGYSLVQPNRDVELELHTSSGVYTTVISAKHTTTDSDGNTVEVDIFEEGYIYDVKLSFNTDGSIGAILEKEGEERYYDLSALHEFEVVEEPIDKSVISTYRLSNCYLLDPNEYKDGNGDDIYDGYCFLATIVGNGEAGIISAGAQTLYPEIEDISPVTAQLLWESRLGLITDIELKYGYIRFKLPDSSARGNAVVAAYNQEDDILWSWHIWITDRPSEQSFSVGAHTITMLDRNIGATSALCNSAEAALDTYGLYYQWGRKDPSMGPPTYNYAPINLNTAPYYDFSSDEKSATEVTQFAQPTLRNGVENPMYLVLPTSQPLSYIFNWTYQRYDFLWGYDSTTGMTTKTIYDPCPFGYRVPSSELSALFSMGSGSVGEYGYTRTVDGAEFFFPYAGFKGVDVGLNSLIGSWKYVGQKGDYQSSMYCTNADAENSGGIGQYMHRSRIYLSKESSWNETNVGTYSGNVHIDFANRRTAAPVRCVKDESIGSITATLTPSSNTLIANSQMTLSYKARSYGSAIENVTITATYTDTAGVLHSKVLREFEGVGSYTTDGTLSYVTPSDYNESGVIFNLVVRNEHGLTYTEERTIIEGRVEITFNRWENAIQSDITNATRNYVIVGEDIRYYVNVSANNEPSSVSIGGIEATKGGEFDGSGVSNTIWYIPWSSDAKGIYEMECVVTMSDSTTSTATPSMLVYGLTLGERTTTIDTSGATMYMWQNAAYTSTYMTATGTTLAASTSTDYYNLFTVEGDNIRSVARGSYLNGTNGNISFSATATDYTIARSGNNIRISYESGWSWLTQTYYVRQTSTTAVSISTGTTNRNWNLIPVTFDIP